MKKINFIGQFYGCLGIPNHSRAFAEALIDNMEQVNLVPIQDSNDPYGITPKISSHIRSQIDPTLDTMIFWYPNTFNTIWEKSKAAGKKYGYFIFEYTIIPKDYVEALNRLDGVFTASQWGVDVLKSNGVTAPLHVIPGGVDHSIFNSSTRNLDTKRFRFIHIGKAENRKGTSLVIQAFNEAFKGDRTVRLSLFIDNPHLRSFDSDMFLHSLHESLGLKYPTTNIDVRHFEQDIVNIYNTHHAAVFASKAEGIGLPIVEAMSCGLPVITPFNSGITAYANDDNAILIKDLVEEPIYDPTFFPQQGLAGTWNSPKVEALSEKMRWVYENYDTARLIGERAEQYLSQNYSWDIAAKKLAHIS
jgi:glycosyltransferase involved in cell wall biosynthesis